MEDSCMYTEAELREQAEKRARIEAKKLASIITRELDGNPGEALAPLKKFKQSLNPLGEGEEVIFNGPATVLYAEDGNKYVSKCSEDDIFDPVKGYLLCKLKEFTGARNGEISRRMDEIRGLYQANLANTLNKIFQRLRAQMEKIVEERKSETFSEEDLEGALYQEGDKFYQLVKMGEQPLSPCNNCVFYGDISCSETRQTACKQGYVFTTINQEKARKMTEDMVPVRAEDFPDAG